jgi:hypothetical protein
MAENLICPKCNSTKIIPGCRIMDRGHYSGDAGDLTVVFYDNPNALIFKGTHQGTLYAQICGDCGFTEMFLEDAQEVYAAYLESQQNQE